MKILACACALVIACACPSWAQAPDAPAPVTQPVRVEIEGVNGAVRRNIRANVALVQRRADPEMPESTVRALFERGYGEIRTAMRPFGYYQPVVTGTLTRGEDRWVARYRVQTGPVVRYSEVELEITGDGRSDPVLRQVLPASGIAPGEPLRHEAWTQAKQRLLNRAASRGYLDARTTRTRVEVDTSSATARAILHVETGTRFRFGEVRFEETSFERGLLERYVTFEPGEYFDLDALLRMQRLLRSSDYFQLVTVEPVRDQADGGRVPIRVELEPRPRTEYTVGAGYGTDTGVRGRGSGQRRWLNPAGHRVQGEARASFRTQAFQGQYVIPLYGGPADRLASTAVVQRESFEGLESRVVFGRFEWDHGRAGWREVVSLRLLEEWFSDADVDRSSTLLIPELSWSRVRGEDALYPRRGYRVNVAVSGASDAVVSDLSFAKVTADLNAVRGLHDTGRLLVRLNLGTTAVGDIQELPVSLRLYAGGDRSIRGFAFRSTGPVGTDGSVTGGRHRVVGSLELEQRVWGPVAAAVFTDGGNVFDRTSSIAVENAEYCAGFGVRWRSPFGPVRGDVAWPLSRPGTPPRFHFSVGGAL